MAKSQVLALVLLAGVPAAFSVEPPIPAKLEYNRDVRPILADTCFRCHGFDKNTRKADLRLDVRAAAVAEIDGIHPIAPGKPAESEAWRRIITTEKDDLMPPPKEARQLSAREKEIIKRWIEQGAEYQPHWAYIAPQKPAPPDAKEPGFTRTPIDQFALARQRSLGLNHVGPAARPTLIRRLYLDLVGLPPTAQEVDDFVNDGTAHGVDQLFTVQVSMTRNPPFSLQGALGPGVPVRLRHAP